jgi:hypothetical protein
VRPGSRTKVSVPLVLPQTRHPERSASPIDRVIQRLWRGVEEPVLSVAEGTPAVLISPMLFRAFQPPSRTERVRYGFTPGAENQELAGILLCPAPTSTCSQILLSGFGGRKAPSSMGETSTAEVPSATLRTGSSATRHKRCVTRSIGGALRSG